MHSLATKDVGQKPLVVSVTSGKGGVGKTLTTVHLALAGRRMQKRVLIFDGDTGLANIDVVLGLQVKWTIKDVLDGRASLADVIVEGPSGIKIIPSGSGIFSLAHLSTVDRHLLLGEIEKLHDFYDLVLIDTGAGIAENVLAFNSIAHETIVVTTPEPHAMTDAYAIIKVTSEKYGKKSFQLVVNQTRSEGEGLKVAQRVADVANRFLGVEVEFAGQVPADPQMRKWVMQRQVGSDATIHSISGQAWNRIAKAVIDDGVYEGEATAKHLWRHLVGTQAYARQMQVGI